MFSKEGHTTIKQSDIRFVYEMSNQWHFPFHHDYFTIWIDALQHCVNQHSLTVNIRHLCIKWEDTVKLWPVWIHKNIVNHGHTYSRNNAYSKWSWFFWHPAHALRRHLKLCRQIFSEWGEWDDCKGLRQAAVSVRIEMTSRSSSSDDHLRGRKIKESCHLKATEC